MPRCVEVADSCSSPSTTSLGVSLLEARLALYSCTLMPDHRVEGDVPTETKPEDSKQCRICLDGEDPELGRLIRPCLCKGSISVCSCWLCTCILNLPLACAVCSRKMPTALAQYFQLSERLLHMSAMWLSLPFCSYSRYGYCNEPK